MMKKKADKLEVNKNLHQRIRRRERNNKKVKTKKNDDEINNKVISYILIKYWEDIKYLNHQSILKVYLNKQKHF